MDKKEIAEKYQAFKETDEFKEILKEMKIDRPDVTEYLLEMYIFGWFVQDRLQQPLEEPTIEKPKKYVVQTAIDVCSTEDEWKAKYPLNEIIPANGCKNPFKLEEVKILEPNQDVLKVEEIFPDVEVHDILMHGQILKKEE